MDQVAECSKRNCEDGVTCIPIQSKKRKLNNSLSAQSDRLNEAECAENTKDPCPNKILKQDNHETVKYCNEDEDISNTIDDSSKRKSLANIFSLSDEIMLILLSYFDSSDILYLGRCDSRLFNICGDKSLWVKVNASCDGRCPPHDEQALFFHSGTTHLRFVKTRRNDSDMEDTCFKDDFFQCLSNYAPNLKSLVIENHILSSEMFTLKYLPQTITELRFPKVELLHSYQDTYYFHNISTILPNLEIVDLSYCQWLNAHALLALAKCNNLKELRMAGCRNLKDFIPYASIAAAFGFKKLQTLDLRLTGIVDREIACFNKTKSLKHIYLEKPADMQNAPQEESVTDVCITQFGMRSCHSEPPNNMVFITRIPKDGGSYMDYTLETLVVRNYPGITDITLKHAQKCLKSLKYLDVTGCSCTAHQATSFKQNRPEVQLIYNGVAM